ncbi:MAG TPA: hypothetical protein VMD75_06505 [Candidatus Binataceae bacterium]|nr:hypothetical protein [Candidatus Binataceae bacterium]
MANELLLIGSIPLETPEEVFRKWGSALGRYLPSMPDGEVGDRSWWIDGVANRVFNGHPQIETISRPADDPGGVEQWRPRNLHDQWDFRVKPGVAQVKFGDPGWRLGFAKDAVNSYFIFKSLKQEGVIPAHLRFQVSVPSVNSNIEVHFHHPEDYPHIKPGYEAALCAEVAKICEKIPPKDVAIQYDLAAEIIDLEKGLPWAEKAGVMERHVPQIRNLSAAVHPDAMLGIHLCYGTLGGWPMVMGKDMAPGVRFANALVAEAKRHVDFLHIPTLDRTEDEFYAPLKDLQVGDTRVYLGMIHNMGDLGRFRQRLLAAKKFLPNFGLSAPCGYGRENPANLPAHLKEHIDAVEVFKQVS